ncbi:MAG TPA: hypothetical protein VIT22_00250, partial [Pseudoxanthomonas sp.]
HRAHHAVNDRYLDRNYGGIFILWDRMFGSFVEEDDRDPPVYGTRAPLRSWNPLWANLEVYWAMAQDAWYARRWRDKLRVWFAAPGWRPADVAERFPKPSFDQQREDYDPFVSPWMKAYCLLQFVLALGFGVHFLQTAAGSSLSANLTQAAFLMATLMLIGALLEGRRWPLWPEVARLALLGLFPLLAGRWLDASTVAEPMRIGFVIVAAISLSLLLPAAWKSRNASLAGETDKQPLPSVSP